MILKIFQKHITELKFLGQVSDSRQLLRFHCFSILRTGLAMAQWTLAKMTKSERKVFDVKSFKAEWYRFWNIHKELQPWTLSDGHDTDFHLVLAYLEWKIALKNCWKDREMTSVAWFFRPICFICFLQHWRFIWRSNFYTIHWLQKRVMSRAKMSFGRLLQCSTAWTTCGC